MSVWSNTIDELANPEAYMAEMGEYLDEREREWATNTAREIGEALFENGNRCPALYGTDLGAFEPFTYWPSAVEALGLREAIACARQGWMDASEEEDAD